MFRTRFNLHDVIAAIVVVFLACAILFLPLLWRREGEVLVVSTPDGSAEYRLSENREIQIESNGVQLTVVIRNGEAYVAKSTCRDGVCVSSGHILRGGESIVCAPAGVRLQVKGGGSNVDFVAG